MTTTMWKNSLESKFLHTLCTWYTFWPISTFHIEGVVGHFTKQCTFERSGFQCSGQWTFYSAKNSHLRKWCMSDLKIVIRHKTLAIGIFNSKLSALVFALLLVIDVSGWPVIMAFQAFRKMYDPDIKIHTILCDL